MLCSLFQAYGTAISGHNLRWWRQKEEERRAERINLCRFSDYKVKKKKSQWKQSKLPAEAPSQEMRSVGRWAVKVRVWCTKPRQQKTVGDGDGVMHTALIERKLSKATSKKWQEKQTEKKTKKNKKPKKTTKHSTTEEWAKRSADRKGVFSRWQRSWKELKV